MFDIRTDIRNTISYFEQNQKSTIEHLYRIPNFDKRHSTIKKGPVKQICELFSGDYGRLAENTVFVELKRRGEDIYYWKDGSQNEVDFVLKRKNKIREVIQVCWNLEEKKTKQREIRALVSAMKAFGLNQGIIITEDYEGREKNAAGNIIYVPLWKWLLVK